MKIPSSLLLSFVLIATTLLAQTPIEHPQKMYRDADGRLFANRNQPMYLMLSSDPKGANAEALESESDPKYANPFYFDTEGINTIRTPSKVDPITKKLVYPISDVIFEVHADGIAPVTTSKYTQSKHYKKEDTNFYSGNLKVVLQAKDQTSGVEKVLVSIDKGTFKNYSDSLSFPMEKAYSITYYSLDNVGNAGVWKTETFTIDKTAPSVNWKLDGEVSGKTASGRSFVELMAMDGESGLKSIKYQIDETPIRLYKTPIPLSIIGTGEHRFKYWAEDNVGNISESSNGMDNDISVYAFIVDDVPPTASFTVEGDQYQGKYLFVSNRSQFKLDAEDDQLGINKITYSINHQKLDMQYSAPTKFEDTKGQQAVYFQSYDMVSNKSKIEKLLVYMDNETPQSGIEYKGPQFFNRDTMFINKHTTVNLFAEDGESGIKSTRYKVDNKEWVTGNDFIIEEAGRHIISFKTTDLVNNEELVKETEFVVDNEGPEVFVNFSIKPIRKELIDGKTVNVYPPFVKMYIGATDVRCGTDNIWYSVDGAPRQKYSSAGSPADLQRFKAEKTYTVVVETNDMLGNSSSKEITFIVAKK